MNNLEIIQRQNENVVILDLIGKIRLGEDIIKLRSTLVSLISKGEKQILLNLENISHIDSSGLGELVAGFVSLKKNEGELKLLHLTERVNELMVITKLLTVFDTFDNEQKAIESFQTITRNTPSVITEKLPQTLLSKVIQAG